MRALGPWRRRVAAVRGRLANAGGRLVGARGWLAVCASVVAALLLASPGPGAIGHRAPTRAKPVRVHRARGAPTPQPLVRVLFVGASITSGLEQTSLDETYPGRVVTGLRQQGFQVAWQERARSGATVADATTWPYPSGQQIIVVHLITNDFLRGTPLDSYQQTLHRVLVDLRQRSPKAHLVCLGTWEAPTTVNVDHVPLPAYDGAAQQVCDEEHGQFVPLDSIFATPGTRGPLGQATPWGPTDGWHPNDVGAQSIADAVLATIPRSAEQG